MDITAQDFFAIHDKFKLGFLPTQQGDPLTQGLSDLCKKDLPKALDVLRQMDIRMLDTLLAATPHIQRLHDDVMDTLNSGHRVFISGCGATGRLALTIESQWRRLTGLENVVAFMAGGDAALVKSVQDFQDHPDFGEQQMKELGFTQDDLLICSTEGGETWWVIGTVQLAARVSKSKPWILYCNPDELLMQIERSKQFLIDERINKMNLYSGAMAIRGSTRMQASTILQAAFGLALLLPAGPITQSSTELIARLKQALLDSDLSKLEQLILYESSQYEAGRLVTYQVDPYYLITAFTDTTERSPTFSLAPFERPGDKERSWIWVRGTVKSGHQGWQGILGRAVRALDSPFWAKYKNRVSTEICMEWNFNQCINRPDSKQVKFTLPLNIQYEDKTINLLEKSLGHHFLDNLFLKMLINNASTVIMGKLSRFESNVMTYVKATNFKLIDRVVRNVQYLRPHLGFEEIVRKVFEIRHSVPSSQPIVLKVIQQLQKKK